MIHPHSGTYLNKNSQRTNGTDIRTSARCFQSSRKNRLSPPVLVSTVAADVGLSISGCSMADLSLAPDLRPGQRSSTNMNERPDLAGTDRQSGLSLRSADSVNHDGLLSLRFCHDCLDFFRVPLLVTGDIQPVQRRDILIPDALEFFRFRQHQLRQVFPLDVAFEGFKQLPLFVSRNAPGREP